ncbi:MAG: ABC transporter ATP-binding protein [Gammaproteobacteria bacterium]|nr:ABC transporter ATP-binding protein [Gammaproteobacteria bacterium]
MQNTDNQTVVICTDLSKTYQQGLIQVHALSNINFEVNKGEFICLSGPSGSGKSTLLNMIGGLDTPSSGKVYIDGEEIDKLNKSELADMRLHKIGFVFQAYNLIPVLTAQENIEMVMQMQGVSKNERHHKSLNILQEVGLGGLENRKPTELSGGQQQRIAVARAIVSRPSLVLADEPTANLDSLTASKLIDLMLQMNELHNTTFIISTHDPMIMQRSKKLVKLHDGKIIDNIIQKNNV